MEYENHILSSAQLPLPEEVDFEKLASQYRVSVLLTLLITVSIIVALMSIVRFQPFVPVPEPLSAFYPYGVLIVVCLFSLIMVFQFFAIPQKGYSVRHHDLHFASGLIFKKVISQPILRIQHVELKRGPIERMFDLATLQVFSAGGATHTFEIPGMPHSKANTFREFILSHKDTHQDG